jgi:hypothetical protein
MIRLPAQAAEIGLGVERKGAFAETADKTWVTRLSIQKTTEYMSSGYAK